jgi:hypothetical protein
MSKMSKSVNVKRENGRSNCNINIDDVSVEYNDTKKEKMWDVWFMDILTYELFDLIQEKWDDWVDDNEDNFDKDGNEIGELV